MRVLLVNKKLNMGGIETFIINFVKNTDMQKNKIDILCIGTDKYYYDDELESLGCNIYKVEEYQKIGIINFSKKIIEIIKQGNYDVVHSNIYLNSSLIMLLSFIAGVKIRVTHSHATYLPQNTKEQLAFFLKRQIIRLFSNRKIACSKKAGEVLFGKNKYVLLENGVDLEKYKYDSNKRVEVRKKYNILDNEILIGHVGRFDKVKNHEFMIKIIKNMTMKEKKYKLMLIGDGEEFNNIKNMVINENITSSVIFVGSVKNANDFYSAFDCILFPSIYEGLPFVFVEGQINGLNIIASDTISNDSNLINNVTFLNLDCNISEWSNTVIEKSKSRHHDEEFFKKSNYNINNTVKRLFDIYSNKY